MKKTGRASTFTQEIADIICVRLARGESLNSMCKDAGMPHISTVYDWMVRHKVFAENYARARETQADTIFDECMDIADDARNDFMTKMHGDKVVDNEAVQRSRLRIDTRKWMAGKLRPKKYGDKLDVAHTDAGMSEDGQQSIAMIARRVALVFRLAAMEKPLEIEGGATEE